MALELNATNFKDTIENNQKPVIVDFWAAWCGPCRVMNPTIEDLSENYDGAVVAKVNVDENPELAQLFQIRSIPTILYFKNGKVADKSVGVSSKTQIIDRIEALQESEVG